jgi:hypothetical protein
VVGNETIQAWRILPPGADFRESPIRRAENSFVCRKLSIRRGFPPRFLSRFLPYLDRPKSLMPTEGKTGLPSGPSGRHHFHGPGCALYRRPPRPDRLRLANAVRKVFLPR